MFSGIHNKLHEQDATITPLSPSTNRSDWRYVAEIPQIISPRKQYSLLDHLRLWYPLKFDFCRMTIHELTDTVDAVIREDQQDPTSFRPIVAIGHTKDLIDLLTGRV